MTEIVQIHMKYNFTIVTNCMIIENMIIYVVLMLYDHSNTASDYISCENKTIDACLYKGYFWLLCCS